MRVLFIYTYKIGETLMVTPPLGYMSLGAFLIRDGFQRSDIRVVDMHLPENDINNVIRQVRTFDPDVIGLSCLTFEAPYVRRLTALLKGKFPGKRIVMGGPHPSSAPESVGSDPNIDALVVGEGERPLKRLLDAWQYGGDGDGIGRVGIRRNGGFQFEPPDEPLPEMGDLPFPDHRLIDLPCYWDLPRMSIVTKGKRYAPLITSRGCPYSCSFCHNLFGRRFRPRSADNVIEEIEDYERAYGIDEVHFYDDIFNLDRERTVAILGALATKRPRLALCFPNALRGDLLDEELIDLFVEAGTYKIGISVESASPRMQREIGKNLDLKKVRRIINYACSRPGLVVQGFFMMGFPGETIEDMERTAEFMRRSPLHLASLFVPNPYPGTALAQALSGNGGIVSDEAEFSYVNTRFNRSEADQKCFRRIYRSATRRFYMNPRRILRLWRALPRKGALLGFLPYLRTRLVLGSFLRRRDAQLARRLSGPI